MAEKKLLTRIIMNHGEWSTYAGKKAKDGEVIYVKVGTTQANGKVSEPIWMQKIGDGVTEVQNLPWVVAPAADVYEWAKKSSLDANDLPAIPGDKLGLTVTVTGDGNAVTDASWDAVTKTLTLTKGETFLKESDFVDTTYEAGIKLDLDGTTFNHETTERKDTTDEADVEFGKTIEVIDSVTSDETGHITAVNKKTITLPTPEEVSLPSYEDTAVKGQLVTEVDQNEGKISVTRKAVDVKYDSTTRKIQLTIDKETVGEGFDASEFIKDGMIKSVEIVDTDDKGATGKFLKIVWNTPELDDADVTTYVDLTTLIDVYTAGKGITVTGKEIAHQVKPTSGTAETATAGSGRTYVTEVLVDELGHIAGVKTATETDQDLTHNHDDEYKKIQEVVADPTASGKALEFIDTISQNANGEITATKKSVNLDDYALKSELPTDFGVTKITSNDTTTSTEDNNVSGLKITPAEGTGEVNIEIDDTIVFILNGGDASNLD